MAYSAIKYEERENIAFLTLSRPDVANAVNDTMAAELVEACQRVRQADDVRAVILTGAGDKSFCSGGDLTELSKITENTSPEKAESLVLRHNMIQAIASLDRPLIAAVNGYAIGMGLALALACDIRLASESAVFSAPDVGWGYIPLSGITQRLPRLVGRGKALEMLLTAQKVDAAEAKQIGLVNKVVPADRLLQEAQEWAKRLAVKAPIALRFAKEAVLKGMDLTLEQGLRLEADIYFLLFSTKDRTEGITAFREKRPPKFVGQ